jgi:GTP cyclohydrolase FolE2
VIENGNIGISYLLLEDLIRGMATRVQEWKVGRDDTWYSIVISHYEAIHAKSSEISCKLASDM